MNLTNEFNNVIEDSLNYNQDNIPLLKNLIASLLLSNSLDEALEVCRKVLSINKNDADTINSIGKQWIRRFALALSKETLGQVRSKFGNVPVPGQQVTLNGPALLTEAKAEQQALRDELKTTLAELTYAKMSETDANMIENSGKVLNKVPNYIFVG